MAARLLPFALALLAGLAHALSIAAPWNGQPVWWLQIAALTALVWLIHKQRSWLRAGLAGWAFATACLSGTFWWLFISMHTYGGLPSPLAVMAVVGLAAFLGLYYAVACAVFVRLRTGHALTDCVLFASVWLLAELTRGMFLSGFPWGAAGYAHVDSPLAAFAPWVGVYGMCFLAALVAAGLALMRRPRPWALLWPIAVFAIAAGLLATNAFSTAAGSASVTLLQGNIPQDEKFQGGSGVPQALRWYGEQLLASKTALVVAPETALPMLPQQLPEGYLAAIGKRFASGQQAALIGIPLGNNNEGYTNSVIGVASGELYRFDKHHLVPFGEFIPPFFRWFTDMMNIPLGDFNRGAVGQASFTAGGQRFGPNICYEDLFGEELGARFVDAAGAPTVFVNVSNIGWFGNTVAIDQHLQISRMRALEFERPMIRATNTGATVIIDYAGRVTHSLPRHTRGVLTGDVEGRNGVTPFAWWVSRVGLWPLWALGSLVVFGAGGRLYLQGRTMSSLRGSSQRWM